MALTDGKLVTAAAWPGHPEFLKQFVATLGLTVQGAANKRVLILCGDFMEDYEVMVPFQALKSYGMEVHAVCQGKKSGEICRTAIHDFAGDQTYTEKRGHNFALNANFEDVSASDYDGLVIPGGRAPEYLALNAQVIALVQGFAKSNKPIAAICHGQQILSAADLLKGKKCTAYPACGPACKAAGATWIEPDPIDMAVTDGKLITAAAWPGHPEFVKQFVASLGVNVLSAQN